MKGAHHHQSRPQLQFLIMIRWPPTIDLRQQHCLHIDGDPSNGCQNGVSALCRGPLSTGDAYLQGQQALYKAGIGHGGLPGAHDFHTFPSIALNKHFTDHNPFSMAQAFPEVRA